MIKTLLLTTGILMGALVLHADETVSLGLVPKPAQLTLGQGSFSYNPADDILANSKLVTKVDPKAEKLGAEGYRLVVTPAAIKIDAATEAGAFYARQTLLQLSSVTPGRVPCVEIQDAPRFKWRGLHMDVGRHFMPVDFVKEFIDLLAMHKMNTLHWHLTEDQGWRIEIKKYPRLTTVGATRAQTPVERNRGRGDGKQYGPLFYSQEEIKEIVAYAAERHVTVVPEIELPGHSLAALAAYPYLGCRDEDYKVGTRWGVYGEVYCAGNDEVFTFLEDVLSEVVELFPSKLIHIGGDECPKGRWKQCPKCQARKKAEGLANEHELQSYFIKRIETFLGTKGRNIIGWDEILEGGLAPNAAVMSWRGVKGGIHAAKSGHDAVMSPGSHCYLDKYPGRGPNEPECIGGYIPLKRVYSFEPVPSELTAEEAKHIIGLQGNLWSEYIRTPEIMEYKAYPRGCAIAETGWTPAESKDWEEFSDRLKIHVKRLKARGVNYRPLDPVAKRLKDPTIAREGWTVLSVSSEHNEKYGAAKAFDNNPETFWHTSWSTPSPTHPHHIAIDLGANQIVTGFAYLPRQDKLVDSMIENWRFEASPDGETWTEVAEGMFEDIHSNPTRRIVRFKEPITCRAIRLTSLTAAEGKPYAGAAEIHLLTK